MKTDEVTAAVDREYARLQSALDALGADAPRRVVTPEGWTAKDVLAHCIHWAGQIAWGMGAKLEPAAYIRAVEGRPSFDEWNALAVSHYAPMSFDDVRAELDRIVEALKAQVRGRSDEQMAATDAIPWGGDRPLWKQVGAETFEHWPEHSADLERAEGNAG
jgi:hypothetical protein